MAALVGGFVYRGDKLTALYGKYLFGDIVFGRMFYALASNLADGSVLEGGTGADIHRATLLDSDGIVRSFEHFAERGRADLRFGMDANGEIYVLSKANGSIWTIEAASLSENE